MPSGGLSRRNSAWAPGPRWHSALISFFAAAPDPPPPAARPPLPRWWAPPQDMVGGVLALQLVLARSGSVAVVLSRLVAYPSGFSLDVSIVSRAGAELPNLQARFRPDGTDRDAIERGWRFGIGTADGSKVTVNGGRPPEALRKLNFQELADTEVPPHPIILPGGSGGRKGRWDVSYWVAPLPPPGPVELATRWEEAGLPENVYPVDANVIPGPGRPSQDHLVASLTTRPHLFHHLLAGLLSLSCFSPAAVRCAAV